MFFSSLDCSVENIQFIVKILHMLEVHAQRHKPTRRRQFSEPNLFYDIGEPTRQTSIPSVTSARRRKSDPRNGITVNISGKKYFITVELLSRYPDSLLSHRHKRKYFYDCIRDEYFFDRNRSAFESIFTFYVSKGSLVSPGDEEFPQQLLADELHFFGLYQYLSKHDKMNNVVIPSGLKKERVIPNRSWQKELWKICEVPDSSLIARLINLISLLIIITSVVILCLDTLPVAGRPPTLSGIFYLKSQRRENDMPDKTKERIRIMRALEAFCIGWFTFELFIRFLVSPLKKKFFLQPLNVIDLVAIVPFYISFITSTGKFGLPLYLVRVLRLFKIFQVMKISRYLSVMKVLGQTINSCFKDIWTMNFLILVASVLFGSVVYYFEQWDRDTMFISIPDSCWWALVTLTTLGYGDMAPATLGTEKKKKKIIYSVI